MAISLPSVTLPSTKAPKHYRGKGIIDESPTSPKASKDKLILIARVSTEEQKEAGNSLPVQINKL